MLDSEATLEKYKLNSSECNIEDVNRFVSSIMSRVIKSTKSSAANPETSPIHAHTTSPATSESHNDESIMPKHPFNTLRPQFRPMASSFSRPSRRIMKIRMKQRKPCKCVVCGERASGMYFGAMVCLPCKSFFIRCTKDGQPQLTCLGDKTCSIDRTNRMRCQYCRYQKCLRAGMMRREKPEIVEPGEGQELCRVCADIANGIHFGVMTCEGCKKFFRRALKEAETYECKFQHACALNPRNRNACRLCRYNKCLNVGMSRQAIRMGRPKKVKSESSTYYEDNYTFNQQMPMYGNHVESMQMLQPINGSVTLPVNMAHYHGSTYGPKVHSYFNCHPHSPSAGTDSGIESDRGSPMASSPVGSPTHHMSPMTSKTINHQQPVFPSNQTKSCSIQERGGYYGQLLEVKKEPADYGENNSVYFGSVSSCALNNSNTDYMNHGNVMFHVDSQISATEVKLEQTNSADFDDAEFDIDDINDVLATLGHQLGNFGQSEASQCQSASFQASLPVQSVQQSQYNMYNVRAPGQHNSVMTSQSSSAVDLSNKLCQGQVSSNYGPVFPQATQQIHQNAYNQSYQNTSQQSLTWQPQQTSSLQSANHFIHNMHAFSGFAC